MLSQRLSRALFRMSRKLNAWSHWLPGSKTVKLFGETLRFTRASRVMHLPLVWYPIDSTSEIVRYADFVQTHAIVSLLESIPQPVVVDVGAYHGLYAVLLGKLLQQRGGRMIAVEPEPDSFQVLCENVRLNGLESTVTCECCALSDVSGRATINSKDAQSQVHLSPEARGNVELKTLEELLTAQGIQRVDVLIVDTEGMELPILRGIGQAITVGNMFCELHPYAWQQFGYSRADVDRFLEERDLICLDMFLRPLPEIDPGSERYIGPALITPRKRFLSEVPHSPDA